MAMPVCLNGWHQGQNGNFAIRNGVRYQGSEQVVLTVLSAACGDSLPGGVFILPSCGAWVYSIQCLVNQRPGIPGLRWTGKAWARRRLGQWLMASRISLNGLIDR